MRVATPEFGTFALVEIRVLVACMVLLPVWFFHASYAERRLVVLHWRSLVFVGCLNSATPFLLFAWSTLHISGGFSSILNSTAPVWTALVAWLWLKRTPSYNVLLGLAFGVLGVIVLVSGSVSTTGTKVEAGIFAATLAAFFYGVAANVTMERLQGVSPVSIATFSLLAAAIMLLPFAVLNQPTQAISGHAWAAVIAMGVLSTALANIIYFYLLSVIGSTRAITVTFLIPVFGTLWGVLFIDEKVTSIMLVGGSVILFGTALVTGLVRPWKTMPKQA